MFGLNPWHLLGGLALCVGAFFLGHSYGVDSGLQRRQQEVNDLNLVITKMAQKELDEKQASQKRISEINAKSLQLAQENLELQAKIDNAAQNVVVKWKTKLVPGTCGLSSDTTSMIREVLKLSEERK